MATVNLYLSERTKKTNGKKHINLFVRGIPRGDKRIIVIAVGETIDPQHWDTRRQRAKRQYTGSPELNSLLDRVCEDATRICRTFSLQGVTSHEEAKRILRAHFLKETEQAHTFFQVFDEFVAIKGVDWQVATIKKYKTLRSYLLDYANRRTDVTFETIDRLFYDQFRHFLLVDKTLLNNTVSKVFAMLKTFLNWATERGYNKSMAFKGFKTPNDKVDAVYLTEPELMTLYYYDFSDNPRLEAVRDVFCFQCFTGQRFSDVAAFRYDHVQNDVWTVHTQKTKDIIRVPLNEFALELLGKHRERGKLPVISAQKTNDYIKEVCRIVGITQPVTIVQHRGKDRLERVEQKCDLVATHTARRTFVTLSLEKGMRPEEVMKITGHTDLKMLQKYVKITETVTARAMREVWKRPTLRLVSNQ
jgi:integrase